MTKKGFIVLLVLLTSFVNISFTNAMESMTAEAGVMVGGALMVPNLNIVENAVNANNVTTVVAAVKAAGLVDTLMSEGPFTVFAPTNDAFAKLPAGTVDTLLKPENLKTLQGILTYHVIAGRLTSSDLTDGKILTTVQGEKLYVSNIKGKISINGAMIETKDVISSNGVTHVIDSVLLPLSSLGSDDVFKIKIRAKFGAKFARLSMKQKENLSMKLDMYLEKTNMKTTLSASSKMMIATRIGIIQDILDIDMEDTLNMILK